MRYIRSGVVEKPKKSHACIWCGECCPKGEPVYHCVYIDDGFQSNYFHLECDLACTIYFKEMRRAGHYENQFEPYEFARGSVLDKHDFKLEEAQNDQQ